MGKAALFAIAAFALMGGYYTLSAQRTAMETGQRLAGHQFEVIARNAAMAGYMRARQGVADEEGFTVSDVTGEFEGASYTASVTYSGMNRGVINARGWVTDGKGRSHEYTVRAEVERTVTEPDLEELPVFMRYGLISEGDLTISGHLSADTLKVLGNEDNVLNANVHTNGSLTVKGKAASIRGYGTYSKYVDVPHLGVFQPYNNTTNAKVVDSVERVDIPVQFDMQQVLSNVNVDVDDGPSILSGEITYSGDAEDPTIVYVPAGGLTVSSDTKITGHVIFLVDGDITFNGNVTLNDGRKATENSIGFYASNDVIIGGSAGAKVDAIWGEIIAGNDVKFHGTPTIYGGVVAGGKADIVGTPNIKFLPPAPSLALPFVEPEVHLALISYNER